MKFGPKLGISGRVGINENGFVRKRDGEGEGVCLSGISSSEALMHPTPRRMVRRKRWQKTERNLQKKFISQVLKKKSWSAGEKKSKMRENGLLVPLTNDDDDDYDDNKDIDDDDDDDDDLLSPFISTASTKPRRRRSTAGRLLCAI